MQELFQCVSQLKINHVSLWWHRSDTCLSNSNYFIFHLNKLKIVRWLSCKGILNAMWIKFGHSESLDLELIGKPDWENMKSPIGLLHPRWSHCDVWTKRTLKIFPSILTLMLSIVILGHKVVAERMEVGGSNLEYPSGRDIRSCASIVGSSRFKWWPSELTSSMSLGHKPRWRSRVIAKCQVQLCTWDVRFECYSEHVVWLWA